MLIQSVTKRPMCQYVTLGTLARLNDITAGKGGLCKDVSHGTLSALNQLISSETLSQGCSKMSAAGWPSCALCAEVILPRMLPVLALANVVAILSSDWFCVSLRLLNVARAWKLGLMSSLWLPGVIFLSSWCYACLSLSNTVKVLLKVTILYSLVGDI